MFHLRNNVLL